MLGRFPDDFFYPYYAILIATLVCARVFHYYSLGYHYYITDFCYYGNWWILYYMHYDNKSDILFKVCFLFGNGVLARSVYLFRNSLVMHRIDFLTSLGIHLAPFICTYHIRWYTMQDQKDFPAELQRFANPIIEDNWFDWSYNMVLMPVVYYLLWLIPYGMLNFVFAKKDIDSHHY